MNNVANEMKNPLKTVKTAGPTALGLVFFLYFFANSTSFKAVSVVYSQHLLQLPTWLQSLFQRLKSLASYSLPNSSQQYSAITLALVSCLSL